MLFTLQICHKTNILYIVLYNYCYSSAALLWTHLLILSTEWHCNMWNCMLIWLEWMHTEFKWPQPGQSAKCNFSDRNVVIQMQSCVLFLIVGVVLAYTQIRIEYVVSLYSSESVINHLYSWSLVNMTDKLTDHQVQIQGRNLLTSFTAKYAFCQ